MNGPLAKFLAANQLADPWPSVRPNYAFDDHGWFGFADEVTIRWLFERFVLRSLPFVVEVGSWLGRSTRFFAEMDASVVAVDTWLGSPEHREPARADCVERLPDLYGRFLANCWDLRQCVLPLRLDSQTAARGLFWPADFADAVFLDADHSHASVVSDIVAWSPVLHCGLLCGHDAELPSVWDAVIACVRGPLAAREIASVGREGNIWWVAFNQ